MAKKKGGRKKKTAEEVPQVESPEVQNTAPEGVKSSPDSFWDSFDVRAAVGTGFYTLTNRQVEDVLKAARAFAHGEPQIVRPAWQRIRGAICAVYRARNGWLGLSLGRKWPAPGAFVAWLPPDLAARFHFSDKHLIGQKVEVVAIWWTEDGGKTLQANLATADQIRFLWPENPDLPPCDPASPGPEALEYVSG